MKTYWIWCDLDGKGKKWRFAIDGVAYEDAYYFVKEDFEEKKDVFKKYPRFETVHVSPEAQDAKVMLEGRDKMVQTDIAQSNKQRTL